MLKEYTDDGVRQIIHVDSVWFEGGEDEAIRWMNDIGKKYVAGTLSKDQVLELKAKVVPPKTEVLKRPAGVPAQEGAALNRRPAGKPSAQATLKRRPACAAEPPKDEPSPKKAKEASDSPPKTPPRKAPQVMAPPSRASSGGPSPLRPPPTFGF